MIFILSLVTGIVDASEDMASSIANDSYVYDWYHNVDYDLLVDIEYPYSTFSRTYS